MKKSKSSISQARSYTDIGEFWDKHDLSDVWGKTRGVGFDVDIKSEVTYYPIEQNLSEKIQLLARKQGLSSGTLVNLWLEQKMREQGSSSRTARKLTAKNA
ncbi:MAG TPA: CopG family antitoxin [Verrucomicrobiae bacterium]|nr:CopG family antitoxin [Verrucomicrobiae bacterium]